MFYELVHLAQTYLISMQLLKKKEIFFYQTLLFSSCILFLFFNLLLYI